MIFQWLVTRIRKSRVQHAVEKAHARERAETLRGAIEHVVDEINPKIRAVSGYRKKLAPAVERSLDYCLEIVAMIPGPPAFCGCWPMDFPIARSASGRFMA